MQKIRTQIDHKIVLGTFIQYAIYNYQGHANVWLVKTF